MKIISHWECDRKIDKLDKRDKLDWGGAMSDATTATDGPPPTRGGDVQPSGV